MSFKATDERIYDLIQDKKFLIPDNQRKYIWDETNWQELFDDLILVMEKKLEKHFIGSVVLIESQIDDGVKSHFVIIDGQQRILSLSIVFAVIASIFAEHKWFGSFAGMEKFLIVKDARAVKHTIISDEANSDINRISSLLFLEKYEDIKSGSVEINLDYLIKNLKIKKCIKDCFSFFYEKISSLIGNNLELLESFSNVVQDIRYIQIIAREEDAYTVFEILNARGKPLTDFELLRNFLLKYSSKNEKNFVKNSIVQLEQNLGDYCDIFLKHYAVHKYKVDNKHVLRPYKIISSNEKNSNIEEFVKDLLLKSEYYHRIIYFNGCNDVERKIFSFFKPRRQQQFRPILLGLMHQYGLGNIDEQQYNESINYIYLFFICYNVIGEQTSNKIEDIVNGYSYKLENAFSLDVISDMKDSMWSRIPAEEDFINHIVHIKYSNVRPAYSGTRKAENVKAIIEVLELENGYSGHFDNLTIEHCLPDSDTEENDNVGNLILLEKGLNEKCSNKLLREKTKYYKQSCLTLPNSIASAAENNGFALDVKTRTEAIAKKLYSYLKKLS